MTRRSWWVIFGVGLVALVGCGTESESATEQAPRRIQLPGAADPADLENPPPATGEASSVSPRRLKDSEPNRCEGQHVFCWPIRSGCWLVGTHCGSGNVLMCEYECPPIEIVF